jgi:hypothetical protein
MTDGCVNIIEIALFAATALPGAPVATGQEGISPAVRRRDEICYALATASAQPANLADCLGSDRAQDAAFTAQACNFLRDTDQLGEFDFGSYRACVRDLLRDHSEAPRRER